ncbi:uncharacterized protein Z518_06659 [Rhinocladiella mackenziei CBS 650.93]|uniref:Rhinocladiella mackenziei CBS 650.93 unplaced genomic scaffold supercont1.5, whole genome shotgun sequence n=1 Tax=Rhinocladiella mackenziei CBS 650.93 TaxID=1442369 RepID=A0A0D2IBA1_9EURO|nr:uncharacterized protein Z518_06659 [Rhinocladiella mackenziei CBS 650.93]KIX03109.1 hypothetical protein Z518_06659 [Rhinocladiella mackenziei CBS 650.93]
MPFLSLPLEVRLQIWAYIVQPTLEYPCDCARKGVPCQSPPLGICCHDVSTYQHCDNRILRVSRQIFDEVQPIVQKAEIDRVFVLCNSLCLDNFFKTLNERDWKWVKHLRMDLFVGYGDDNQDDWFLCQSQRWAKRYVAGALDRFGWKEDLDGGHLPCLTIPGVLKFQATPTDLFLTDLEMPENYDSAERRRNMGIRPDHVTRIYLIVRKSAPFIAWLNQKERCHLVLSWLPFDDSRTNPSSSKVQVCYAISDVTYRRNIPNVGLPILYLFTQGQDLGPFFSHKDEKDSAPLQNGNAKVLPGISRYTPPTVDSAWK